MEFQSLNAMSFDAEHIVTKGDTGVERIRKSSFRYGSFLLLGTKKDFETDYVIYRLWECCRVNDGTDYAS